MATPSSIALSERLQRDAVQVLESTIPAEMTLDEWRRLRPRTMRRRIRRRPARHLRVVRHLMLVPDLPYDEDPPLLAA